MQAMEQRKMVIQQKKATRRYSNHFSQRLSQRKSEISQSINELHLTRNEDPHMIKSTDVQYLEDIQELKFHRMTRAVQSQFHGFTTNIPLLQKVKEAASSTTVPEGKKLPSLTSNEPIKSSIVSKFGISRNSDSNSLNKETEAIMIAERNKRKAQDMLLLSQLDAGVLPESFIKSSEDPRYITINLSQYGIGDVRGLCLGKW
jgi:hypothetical protein